MKYIFKDNSTCNVQIYYLFFPTPNKSLKKLNLSTIDLKNNFDISAQYAKYQREVAKSSVVPHPSTFYIDSIRKIHNYNDA